jgi:hypothetical protein
MLASDLQIVLSQVRRPFMISMLHFTTLVVATLLAGIAAVLFHWLLLRAAFHLMKPAAQRRTLLHTELAHGTIQLVRALTPHR